MNNVITTTTINAPTRAIKSYDARLDWDLIVVGDRKTPDYKLDRGTYLDWKYQQDQYPDLCELIGPDSVDRGRMISFIEAHKREPDVVAVIDDDNYAYPHWGRNLIQCAAEVDWYESTQIACDPIHRFFPYLWHRGFPLSLAKTSIHEYWSAAKKEIVPLVQADLWDGDPDVDATLRIAGMPNVQFPRDIMPYAFNTYSPFDSQNTFIAGCVLKDHYANIPFIGRSSDIWASYIFEKLHPQSVIYNRASVFHAQKRTTASLLTDLEDELMGYHETLDFIFALEYDGVEKACETFLPKKSLEAIEMYRNYMEK